MNACSLLQAQAGKEYPCWGRALSQNQRRYMEDCSEVVQLTGLGHGRPPALVYLVRRSLLIKWSDCLFGYDCSADLLQELQASHTVLSSPTLLELIPLLLISAEELIDDIVATVAFKIYTDFNVMIMHRGLVATMPSCTVTVC